MQLGPSWKVWSIVIVVLGCGVSYEEIAPGSVTSVEVNFRGSGGRQKKATCLYSVPHAYTPANTWPLVVALHGYGSNARAFHDLWKAATDSLGFVLLTPQGENQTEEGLGWAWGADAERSVQISIDIVRKAVNVDPRRFYLTGFSAGGTLTYAIGLNYPHIFRGLAPLGAPFDRGFVPQKREESPPSSAFRNLRVYIGHGALENNIATDAQLAAKIFEDLGAKVKFVPYEGVGHGLPEPKQKELARILAFWNSAE